jgi:uncharacterized membrane protein
MKKKKLNEAQIKEINETVDKKIEKYKKEFEKVVSEGKKFSKEELNEIAKEKTEEIKVEVKTKLENEADKQTKFEILGFKIWRLMSYFVIYSFLGFCLETVYGLLTKGVIESRQSFLYGPFCGIYGLGAVIMILILQYFKKNNFTLFAGGYVVGSVIEYFVSLIGEKILHVKWWDYSTEPFNIGGRVCLFYSLAWGILAIWLIKQINPMIDAFIDKIKKHLPKYLLPIVFDIATAFLVFDCIISAVAINVFYARLVYEYKLDIPNSEVYEMAYEKISENESWKNFTDKHFSNEKMLKTYPNLKMEDINGEIIYIKDVLSDIKPYYVKLYTPQRSVVHLTNVETVTYDE